MRPKDANRSGRVQSGERSTINEGADQETEVAAAAAAGRVRRSAVLIQAPGAAHCRSVLVSPAKRK